jgi:hypothetical protein
MRERFEARQQAQTGKKPKYPKTMKEIAETLHLSYNQVQDCWKKCVTGDVFNESALVNKRFGAG